MQQFRLRMVLTIAFLVACGSPTTPDGNPPAVAQLVSHAGEVTLQVTNAAPHGFRLRGRPDFEPVIPQPVSGALALAALPTGTSCLVLPAEVDHITTQADLGRADTLRWFDSAPITLYLVESTSLDVAGETQPMVPADAPGWALAIGADGSLSLSPAARCTP